MAIETIKVPDIGGAESVDVIEVCVAVGDVINAEDALVVLESDKASMDVPSPKAGKVAKVLVKEGDQVSQDSSIVELELESGEAAVEQAAEPQPASAPKAEAHSSKIPVSVPDIGGAEDVEVIEVSVTVGDEVQEGDTIIVLESDKSSMEVPSPASGKVTAISVKEGDKVSQNAPILELAGAASEESAPARESTAPTPAKSGASEMDVAVPDIGGAEDVTVIEVAVAEGDEVEEGDSLLVLESDKASMEVPSPASGKVIGLKIKEGDKVSAGVPICQLQLSGAAPAAQPAVSAPAPTVAATPPAAPSMPSPAAAAQPEVSSGGADVYAGPAVRKLARQLGVSLKEVKASGPRGRIVKDDVRSFVKDVMANRGKAGAGGTGIPAIPEVDFAQFGEIEMVKMSKIKKLTATYMSRNWLNIPHVTQFDDIDITEMDAFRKGMKAEAEKAGVRLTPLPFLIKACAAALRAEPSFNVSMHADGEHIVQKNYVHIGLAVDTPNGLVVPVIRNADQKGLFALAEEATALAQKAREGKLMPKDMQGGCFTISSLGAIGGTGFTPIVNAPEVGILGVSRAEIKPSWNGKEFEPKLKMPLCLSYDHRAINGSDAGRFFTYLGSVLSDVRRLLL